ncbi:SDR family NAD(P)-dependent oxidoreductase [Streptomyces marispadix]|uniref:SDR family NAD(P)-dependent oxidoreductase n=1 Tax=Streptomyces marispadix TaxID=2922868 RepID=UPI0027E343D6|nr:SDR family NAD(P)-dependent oxidoreductase [Streptomyces marispadix]
MRSSHVVTGGGRGIGRAVAERLLAEGHFVVVIEADPEAVEWLEHPAHAARASAVTGDAREEAVAEHAADLAESAGVLDGWVNNAAVFRDASPGISPTPAVIELIEAVMVPPSRDAPPPYAGS